MKKYFGLQKVILALTTLTLVGLSSCNDHNFDWDEAHATQQYEKFTNVFIKEFGKPAEGHQWGFDAAEIAMNGSFGSNSSTRADANGNGQYKQEMMINNIPITVLFGKPADITPREHLEVYAWFLMHRVNWTNTNTNFYPEDIDPATGRPMRTNQSDGTAYLRTDISYSDALSLVNRMAKIEGIKDPNTGGDFQLSELSFLKKEYNNVTGNYNKVNVDHMFFRNAWVQSVANDHIEELDDDEKDGEGQVRTSMHMNYLDMFVLNPDGTAKFGGEHLLDWNANAGYGWYQKTANQNATFLRNCDVNVWTYGSSISSSYKQDKYYVVKLKGDDYEGYYLGMDLAAYGSNLSEQLIPNGVCNDWVIKITDAGLDSYQKCRIMCEDLGGSTITASDIDYNDAVLDVNFDGNNQEAQVNLVLRAAGGTLPLAIFYDETPLFEVHEFLIDATVWGPNHVKSENLYRIMYNTGLEDQSGGEATPRLYCLGFNRDAATGVSYCDNGDTWKWIDANGSKKFDEPFDFQKLKIKVYRPFRNEQGSVADYVETGNPPTTESYWVNLGNINGEAPLKICVPQSYEGNPVRWMKERIKIDNGYPDFRGWVANPADIFWDNPKGGSETFYINSNNQ